MSKIEEDDSGLIPLANTIVACRVAAIVRQLCEEERGDFVCAEMEGAVAILSSNVVNHRLPGAFEEEFMDVFLVHVPEFIHLYFYV